MGCGCRVGTGGILIPQIRKFFVAMIEMDIENALEDERTVAIHGQAFRVERAFIEPEKDMVIFVGSCNGRRKAVRCNASVSDMQSVIMGDLSPLFACPP